MPIDRWTIEQTIRALYLYFQLPFGRLDKGTPEVIELAREVGRTPSAVAMKLSNLASLDPKITTSGRRGLRGASALDRATFQRFYGDWGKLVAAVDHLQLSMKIDPAVDAPAALAEPRRSFRPFEGASDVERTVVTRRGQTFFRNAVLANFDEQCCVTGISDRRLLNASHIRPWDRDVENRHNPANGLALSATFDRAFDRGLITIDQSLSVKVSQQLLASPSENTRRYFQRFQGKRISEASRFSPSADLLAWHEMYVFVDSL